MGERLLLQAPSSQPSTGRALPGPALGQNPSCTHFQPCYLSWSWFPHLEAGDINITHLARQSSEIKVTQHITWAGLSLWACGLPPHSATQGEQGPGLPCSPPQPKQWQQRLQQRALGRYLLNKPSAHLTHSKQSLFFCSFSLQVSAILLFCPPPF